MDTNDFKALTKHCNLMIFPGDAKSLTRRYIVEQLTYATEWQEVAAFSSLSLAQRYVLEQMAAQIKRYLSAQEELMATELRLLHDVEAGLKKLPSYD